MKKILLGIIAATILIGIASLVSQSPTGAANKNDFDPGYIIDDYVFYNSGAMDAGQIQRFLESKNPNCDYWGTRPATEWGYPHLTRAQFAEHKRNGTGGIRQDTGFHAPPYRCLTAYYQDTPHMGAASGYCAAIPAGSRTAAQIIQDVAIACGINPQVLIVLLEKEQSLVTDNWPLDRQLRHATGFACPDTAPCNPAYEGFFYQVYNAARQFKVYQAFPNSYNYRAGRHNNIYWHPDLSRCGSSSVYIQNQATAALYIYTPYRPNQAALDNLYGTGDSCSSYGNRNFWRIFTDWFGSTKLSLPGFSEIQARYNQLSGAAGPLGNPIGGFVLTDGGKRAYHYYQKGIIEWNEGIGAWEVIDGHIKTRWGDIGGSKGPLGSPIRAPVTTEDGRIYQNFQNGTIVWRAETGAWESLNGPIRDRWQGLGGSMGPLGSPTSSTISAGNGITYQNFQNGSIFRRDNNAYELVNGAIRDRWIQLGGLNGTMGSPISSPVVTDNGTRQYQYFQNGAIIWREGVGAWESLNGPIRDHWQGLGGSPGVLGSPTSSIVNVGDGTSYQNFQNGTVFWSPSLGARHELNSSD